jgi:hypothetical protein
VTPTDRLPAGVTVSPYQQGVGLPGPALPLSPGFPAQFPAVLMCREGGRRVPLADVEAGAPLPQCCTTVPAVGHPRVLLALTHSSDFPVDMCEGHRPRGICIPVHMCALVLGAHHTSWALGLCVPGWYTVLGWILCLLLSMCMVCVSVVHMCVCVCVCTAHVSVCMGSLRMTLNYV